MRIYCFRFATKQVNSQWLRWRVSFAKFVTLILIRPGFSPQQRAWSCLFLMSNPFLNHPWAYVMWRVYIQYIYLGYLWNWHVYCALAGISIYYHEFYCRFVRVLQECCVWKRECIFAYYSMCTFSYKYFPTLAKVVGSCFSKVMISFSLSLHHLHICQEEDRKLLPTKCVLAHKYSERPIRHPPAGKWYFMQRLTIIWVLFVIWLFGKGNESLSTTSSLRRW